MAALYLHNSIWVPDAETPRGSSPHARTTSSATIQTLPISDLSHPTQPLLHSSTSESVAYLDLLSRQPNHPNAPRGSAMGLSFDGDPTTMRERKGYLEKVVRKRLRRLKAIMAVLGVIMVSWSIYTTVRYFLAFAIYPSSTSGQMAAIVLATMSLVSFALLFAAAVIPFLQIYLLGHNVTIAALLTVRMVLRYLSSLLLLVPAVINFALVFAWRSSSDSALNMGNRCDVDIDVVWSIRSHSTCSPPPWGVWLALSIVRLLLTIAILIIYHFALASYQHTSPTLTTSQLHLLRIDISWLTPDPSTSTLGSGSTSRPTADRRSQRSSPGSSTNRHSNSPSFGENLRLPRVNDSPRSSNDGGLQEEFDPYANLPPLPGQFTPSGNGPSAPSESDRELNSFVDRFRSLVSQINRESEEAAQLAPPSQSQYLADPAFRSMVGYDEFGRPYPPEDHVRILNSYIRRMPTIESIGSREMSATAGGTSVAASSLYQDSRPPTRAMTDRDRDRMSMTDRGGHSEPPSRQGSLSLAAVELINAMGGVEGVPEQFGFGELVDRVRRAGSISSNASGSQSQSGGTGGTGGTSGTTTSGTNVSGASYFTASASPLQTPIVESPTEGLPEPGPSSAQSQPSSSQPSHSRSLPPPPRALMHIPIAEEPSDALPSPSPSLPPLPRALRPLPRPPGLARADSV
ncbi:hypothetical protein MVEN_00305300 [Mycena venus]|uniref:Transmembrane protein n=1 Tax=Mycena venus TaxID=2733690 RepID=A0A8H6Z2P2_9AGAR|nr:hypothetical protein MVEN_00305300 [Mycena venus]